MSELHLKQFGDYGRRQKCVSAMVILLLLCCIIIGCDGGFVMSGRIRDAAGQPIADATIELMAENDEFPPMSAKSDAEGGFWLESSFSPSGSTRTVSISVLKDGFAPVQLRLPLGNRNKDVSIVVTALDGKWENKGVRVCPDKTGLE